MRDDLEHATHALRALVVFDEPRRRPCLRGALRDELELVRRRVLAAFSMRHGTAGFNRVVFQLAQRDPHSHALALEWLDVTLTGTERAAIALLEPRWSDRERLNALTRTFPLAPLDAACGPARARRGSRRPMATALGHGVRALHRVGDVGGGARRGHRRRAVESATGSGTDEDRIVHETLAGIRHRRLDLV